MISNVNPVAYSSFTSGYSNGTVLENTKVVGDSYICESLKGSLDTPEHYCMLQAENAENCKQICEFTTDCVFWDLFRGYNQDGGAEGICYIFKPLDRYKTKTKKNWDTGERDGQVLYNTWGYYDDKSIKCLPED